MLCDKEHHYDKMYTDGILGQSCWRIHDLSLIPFSQKLEFTSVRNINANLHDSKKKINV